MSGLRTRLVEGGMAEATAAAGTRLYTVVGERGCKVRSANDLEAPGCEVIAQLDRGVDVEAVEDRAAAWDCRRVRIVAPVVGWASRHNAHGRPILEPRPPPAPTVPPADWRSLPDEREDLCPPFAQPLVSRPALLTPPPPPPVAAPRPLPDAKRRAAAQRRWANLRQHFRTAALRLIAERHAEIKGEMSRLALEAKAAAQHAEDARSCKVCMDREIDTVFIPCGHLCTCAVCYEINALTECPLCRRGIQRAQHVIR